MTRLTPQAAILLAFQVALATMLVERPHSLVALTVLSAGYWLWGIAGGITVGITVGTTGGFTAGPGVGALSVRSAAVWVLLFLLLGTWSVVLTQGLFFAGEPRTVLLRLLSPEMFPWGVPPGIYLYREGLWHGLLQSLRFDVMILLGAGLLARYGTDEMTGGLRALRLPEPVCFLFSIAMRFLPMLATEARAVWQAQHFRGFRLRALPGRKMGPLGAGQALMLPLLASNLRKADEIAAALLSRGYQPGAGGAAPGGRPSPPRLSERTLCWAGAAALGTLLAGVILTQLHLQGLWSPPGLAWLYILVTRYV